MASSQSADLLDIQEIDTESILAVEQREGLTYIGSLDQAIRHVLKEKLYTAGELLRMEQLKPVSNTEPPSNVDDVLFEGMPR